MIEASIALRLGQLASGHVYPGIAPGDAPVPRITWMVIGGTTGWVLAGWDGSSDTQVQVDCWASSQYVALQLADQTFRHMAEPGEDFNVSDARRLPDDYEDDTRLFRVSWEFSL
jgi:hypothetical protein